MKRAFVTLALLSGLMTVSFAGHDQMIVTYPNANEVIFDRLPIAEKNRINEIRQGCKSDAGAWPEDDYKGSSRLNLDRGISQFHIGENYFLLISYENICNDIVAGYNCSNRGCDVIIYKLTTPTTFSKVLAEHVRYNSFFASMDYDNTLRMLAMSIVGGNKQCVAKKSDPPSHMYCDALVFWKEGRFVFQPIK